MSLNEYKPIHKGDGKNLKTYHSTGEGMSPLVSSWLKPTAQDPASKLVDIAAASTLYIGNTSKLNYAGGSADFSSGGNCEYTFTTVDYFVKAIMYIDGTGTLACLFGDEGATAIAATQPIAPQASAIIGTVTLESNGSVGAGEIEVITQSVITDERALLGGVGGGSGDANSLVGDYKDYLEHSEYEFWTSMIFVIDEDDKNDAVNTTASFSLVTNTIEFTTSQILQSNNLLFDGFLDELVDIPKVDLLLNYDLDNIDSVGPTVQISRNGGNEWQTFTVSRQDTTETYYGTHTFEAETNVTLEEHADTNSDSQVALTDTGSNTKLSQEITPTDNHRVLELITYVNKLGTPSGNLTVKIVGDNAGDPDSTNVLYQSAPQSISSLASGSGSITLTTAFGIAKDTKYHILFETDDAYKNGYSAATNELRIKIDSSSPSINPMKQYNGSTWASIIGSAATYKLSGRSMDLRIKITAGEDSKLKGLGMFLVSSSAASGGTGVKQTEYQQVDTSANTTSFTIGNFIPDKDLLKVYVAQTGQVFTSKTFTLNGADVEFPDKTFYKLPAETWDLVFDQNSGATIDSNDANGALLTENRLGSMTASLDRSQPGQGIILQRPDGTMRELTIDDGDNIVIKALPR